MKHLISILVIVIATSCSAKMGRNPEFVIGKLKTPYDQEIDLDSVQWLTPAVELYYYPLDGRSESDFKNCEVLRTRIIDFQSTSYPDVPFYDLEILYSDYRTVNGLLEYPPYYKFQNPKKIVQCSDELIVGTRRYSLIVNITGRHGSYNETLYSLILIDNASQTIKRVIRYETIENPLLNNVIEKKMDKAINELLNVT